jgi:hypothetical protein
VRFQYIPWRLLAPAHGEIGIGKRRPPLHSRRMKIALILVLALAASLHAQAPAPPAQPPAPTGDRTNRTLFRASLPGGTYEVSVGAIVAVASHEYIVDGIARVTEVNIDTTGALVARFYYLEPVTPQAPGGIGAATVDKVQSLMKEAAERSGQDVWKKVVKNYPTTTHARTIEYRVTEKEHLSRIFAGAEEAFRLGKTIMVTID